MNHSISLPFSLLFLLLLILFLSSFFPSHADVQEDLFSSCEAFDCGKVKGISYPFREKSQPEHCGLPDFVLDCKLDNGSFMLDRSPQRFHVLDIKQEDRVLTVARIDLWDSTCPEKFSNTTLNFSLFHYTEKDKNTTLLYDCDSSELSGILSFPCAVNNVPRKAYFVPGTDLESLELPWSSCNISVVVPATEEAVNRYIGGLDDLHKVIEGGFEVGWHIMFEKECGRCNDSGGRCGHNVAAKEFMCLCPPGIQSYDGWKTCGTTHSEWEPPADQALAPAAVLISSSGNDYDWKLKMAIGIVSGVSAMLFVCIVTCCLRSKTSIKYWTIRTKNDQVDIEAFIRSYGQLTAKRYRFSDVKKMTKLFNDKLGHGGYGEVYRGKLLDGRLVAVKILKASKGNGEEFINEVASISRTSHVNIVTLLGFCLEGHRRALIYEFMPNGSLEKFTYKDNPLQTTPCLEWDKLLQISIGIAQGLEYLHHGCNTKILHLDIKPHNILLDEDLCPKISDFGMAKLCPRKDSIISMANARGTIGYIAPEVYSRNFGGVSSKSDVYSYGMMIVEMVGGRKNIKVGVSHTSEIYFPDWIYKHLKLGSNIQLWEDLTSDENEIARKMILVGLRCIQMKPSDRPSMSKVIEMLKGRLEALQIPPNPSMFSPRSPERFPSEIPLPESSTRSVL